MFMKFTLGHAEQKRMARMTVLSTCLSLYVAGSMHQDDILILTSIEMEYPP